MDIRQFGGAAFPRTRDVWPDPDNPAVADTVEAQEGMSLLDWFAGQALKGAIDRSSEFEFDSVQGYHAWVADEAFNLAGAMLERRRLLEIEISRLSSPPIAEKLAAMGLGGRVTTEEDSELIPFLPDDPSELLAAGLAAAGVDVNFVDVTPEETPARVVDRIDVSNASLNADGSMGLGFRVVNEEAIDAAVAAEEEESTAGAGE